ncbi:MAG: (2Fe-2S) ferredoxin domain-containing protein [Sulfurimonas sp.]|nr:(2Fe-2S) ferredoxin domain-containing protein [Sulfurimonas sp.]
MESKNIKINDMGNEVVDGYACKPVDFDASRPIMHYQSLLFVCDDERCHKAHKQDKSVHLRDIVKDMGLNKGKNRIKVTRTSCNGACRFRAVAQVTTNTMANGNLQNNGLWLKQTHRYKDEQWRKIFKLLSDSEPLKDRLDEDSFIPMKVYN